MAADEMVYRRVKAFDVEHGDDPVRINGWLLFGDGATRQVEIDYATPLIPPPEAPFERAKLVLQYAETRLHRATAEFTELKEALTRQAAQAVEHAGARTPPQPPTAEAVAELKARQATVHTRQKELEAARVALAAAKPAWLLAREAAAAAAEPVIREIQVALADIKI